MDELRANRDRVVDADLVELRLDYVRDPDVMGALAGRRLPVLVTCRPTWEGGRFDGPEERRLALLEEALEMGADYVDIEWQSGLDSLIRDRKGRNIVISMHDFKDVPRDLGDRYQAMRSTGAEVVKIAVKADCLSDTLALLDLSEQMTRSEPHVLIAMGAAGVVTRVLPDRFGSSWTYVGKNVAPGQIDLGRLLEEFRFRVISGSPDVYGVLGSPLLHSLSPVMHNAGFGALAKDAIYLPLEARDIDDFTTFADAFGIRGVSVTTPFKEAMVMRVSTIDELGERIGAINTVRIEEDGWSGINTDVPGFLEPLDGRLELGCSRAVVLGSGGAARSVVVALASCGASVAVCARNPDKAQRVAGLVDGDVQLLPPAGGSWDLLINTTPVGTYPDIDATPMPSGTFDGRLVYDLVYNPAVTRLLADAKKSGCETIGGLSMLVAQAERQFEWWTSNRPPVGLFRQVAERQLGRFSLAATPHEFRP